MPIDVPPAIYSSQKQVMIRYLGTMPRASLTQRVALEPPPSKPRDIGEPFTSERVRALSCQQFVYLPVQKMSLPAPGWWTQRPWRLANGDSYMLTLSPDNDRSTKLCFSSDGVLGDKNSGLGAVLDKSPHLLTESERKDFDPPILNSTKVYSQKLNGKMVLVRESLVDGKKLYRLAFNHNPDSSTPFIPAFITFEAKPAQYKRYINQIKACLKTVKWNDKVSIVP